MNLAYTGRHTPCFHWTALRQGIAPLNPGITGDALFAYPCQTSEHRFLIRTLLNTFSVSPGSLLIYEDNSILFPFINSLPGTGSQTTWIRAMVANSLKIKEPPAMFW